MSNDLELIAHNSIEIIMHEPLADFEIEHLFMELERVGINAASNKQGRILTFDVDADEQMQDILEAMGDLGLVEDIGLIKIVTSLEPQWERATHGVHDIYQ